MEIELNSNKMSQYIFPPLICSTVSSQLWLILLIKRKKCVADLNSVVQYITCHDQTFGVFFNFVFFIAFSFLLFPLRIWWDAYGLWDRTFSFPSQLCSLSAEYLLVPSLRHNVTIDIRGGKTHTWPGVKWELVADTVSCLPTVYTLLLSF